MTDLIHPPQPDWQLAEVNIARLKAPLDDPRSADFANALDRINLLAERMDGFVWRFVEPAGTAEVTDDPLVIFNASVWRDVPALETFVWGTLHRRFYERRAEWFNALGSMHFAIWWVPPGEAISPPDALRRLAHLDQHGPSDTAFGWAEAPGAAQWQAGRCTPEVVE